MGVENDCENGGLWREKVRDSAAKATADISSKLGADNLEGVDNLCAQLSGVGAL